MSVNIPNLLTIMRIAAIFPAVNFIAHGWYLLAIVILAFAAITDYLDGKIARRFKQVTRFGSILDPIADKILISTLFIYLSRFGVLPIWLVALVVFRNFAQIMAIPILSWWLKRDFKVSPKWQPKWASAIAYIIIINVLIIIYGLSPYVLAFLDIILIVEMLILSILEVYVLATYIPRLFQIAYRKHDTFE